MEDSQKNYYRMVEPFASEDASNVAIVAYFAACHELRKTLGLPDVHVIIRCDYMDGDKIIASFSRAHDGHALEAVSMCAWSLGQDISLLDNVIRELR